MGLRRSRPSALPSIAYRDFAVAPITLRAPSRRFLYNSGCRVATLLVSKGVMGFLGDLRGRNSKSPPNPLGLAERRSLLPPPAGRSPSLEEGGLGGFAGQGLPALPSIGYRGFAVAPMTLRAPARKIAVITSGTSGRAMRAPTGTNSFHRCGGPPPSRREVLGLRRSRPTALPSIGYRGFAVAPMTLRAPARRVIITSGINGRAMRAPTGDGGATDGCKCNQPLQ